MLIGLGIGMVIFLVGAFFLQGLRRIPAEPPHKAVVTILGKRTGAVKNEGWRFFPLFPWWYGYINIDITKKNQDLIPREVRTSDDMAEIEVAVSLTWQPDATINQQTEQSYLIEYLNSGGENGVKNIFEDVVEEAVRELAANPHERPFTWEEAVKMKEVFLARIVASILGREISDIPEGELKEIARDLRRGNGKLKLETLGIILSRLNVTSIRPKGKLAEAAEMMAKEERDRKAEVVELNHVAERINALKTLGFSNEQALEVIQTERGKVKKEIKESKWNISPETRAMIEKIGPELVANILRR